MHRRQLLQALATTSGMLALGSLPSTAFPASPYPDGRPIRMLAGFAPGGGTDLIARMYARKLGERLGTQVVVENRPGAGGNIAIQALATMPPDGYSLAMGANYIAQNAAFKRNPYDWAKDLEPIAMVASTANLLTVSPKSPIRSVADLVQYAKAAKKPLTYGSPGVGSATHLSGELFSAMAGLTMLHVPYRGVALAEVDLMAGNIDILFGNISTAARLVTDGKLRALASTGLKRSAAFPDLPTVAETLPGYEVLATWVLVAPARTPREIVERLSRELHAVQQDAELRSFLEDLHAEAMSGGPNEARAFLRDEVGKWEDLIKAANIKLE